MTVVYKCSSCVPRVLLFELFIFTIIHLPGVLSCKMLSPTLKRLRGDTDVCPFLGSDSECRTSHHISMPIGPRPLQSGSNASM